MFSLANLNASTPRFLGWLPTLAVHMIELSNIMVQLTEGYQVVSSIIRPVKGWHPQVIHVLLETRNVVSDKESTITINIIDG